MASFTKGFFAHKLKEVFKRGVAKHRAHKLRRKNKDQLRNEPISTPPKVIPIEKVIETNEILALNKPLPPSPSESETTTDTGVLNNQTPEVAPADEAALLDVQAETLQYVTFHGEDETDYTRERIGIVDISGCCNTNASALLLNLDFSAKIQAALHAERELEHRNLITSQKLQVLSDFQEKLETRISHHQYRLIVLSEQGVTDGEEVSALNDKLDKLGMMQRDNGIEQQSLVAWLQSYAQVFIERQAEVKAYLEAAFVNARLMPPVPEEEAGPESEPAEKDVDVEYRKLCEEMAQNGELDSNADMDLGRCTGASDFDPTPLSPEGQAREKLRSDYYTAKNLLHMAIDDFDRRDKTRQADWQLYEFYKLNNVSNPKDDSSEAFDLRWLGKYQEISRELGDAEEAFANAKAAALEGGVTFDDDDGNSSGFNDPDCGYLESEERAMKERAPVERIGVWMDGIPDGSDPASQDDVEVESDEWGFEEVDISDSASARGYGSTRARIDRWARECGQ